jgi:hypothetical protein
VSFATFCEFLKSAGETMHGWLKVAAFWPVPNAASLSSSSIKISNHLQKIAKDAKAQPLLPAGPLLRAPRYGGQAAGLQTESTIRDRPSMRKALTINVSTSAVRSNGLPLYERHRSKQQPE